MASTKCVGCGAPLSTSESMPIVIRDEHWHSICYLERHPEDEAEVRQVQEEAMAFIRSQDGGEQ